MLLGAMTVLMFAEPKGFAQSPTAPSSNVQQTDLSRPLIVGVVSWPGYAGG